VTFGPNATDGAAACDGCGLTPDTRLAQLVDLAGGTYLLSWYARRVEDAPVTDVDPDGSASVAVLLSDGNEAEVEGPTESEPAADNWVRYYKRVIVPTTSRVEVAVVPRADGPDPGVPHRLDIGGLMLEVAEGTPSPYASTNADRTYTDAACPDSNGSMFRAEFSVGSARLCANGFDGECEGEDAVEHGYREVLFNINQRDIEAGRLLADTGFALGNFNYRIESISVNVVGSNIKDCRSSETPQTCYASGFVPYTLIHSGPYFIRNHLGQDFEAFLFPGRIEHARALGTERYISNPISTDDRELIEPYDRSEFQGRPLDGTFALRVWDAEEIDFNAIADIQVILNYRYWTRFE
jgi:hypothetical protein